VSDRGPVHHEEIEELFRRMVSIGVCRMGRLPNADPESPLARLEWISRPWYSEIGKMVAGWTVKDEIKALDIVFTYNKLIASQVRSDLQKKSALVKHENRVERDRWIRKQYTHKKDRDPAYSIARFRNDLQCGLDTMRRPEVQESRSTHYHIRTLGISIPPKIAKRLRYNRKLIGVEALRRIINAPDLDLP
jgi:hypothetical protein